MAQLRLQPPEPFNFKDPDDWPRWKRWFTQFRTASGLVDESDDKQVSTLLYCLGEEAESVLHSTNATERERGVYETVLQKFDDFFKVRNNIIFERARFNRRGQLQGETAEKYIMALYALAERCDYGGMTEQLIRDRLVVGIRDSALSEKLQLDPKLTLDSAKKAIRQREAVKEQQQALKGFGESSSLEAVQRGTGMGRGRRRQPPQHQRSYQGGKHKGQKHAPEPVSSVLGVAKDSTPERNAQLVTPHVISASERDTIVRTATRSPSEDYTRRTRMTISLIRLWTQHSWIPCPRELTKPGSCQSN